MISSSFRSLSPFPSPSEAAPLLSSLRHFSSASSSSSASSWAMTRKNGNSACEKRECAGMKKKDRIVDIDRGETPRPGVYKVLELWKNKTRFRLISFV